MGSIFASESSSLIHEALGDTKEAIKHRKQEIRLIRRLHLIGKGTAYEKLIGRQYNFADVRDRLIILAMLYHDDGKVARAIDVLEEARPFCKKHGIRFGATELLRDYEKEKADRLA